MFLHLLFLELFGLVLLGLPPLVCSRTISLERFLTSGDEDREVPGQICWSQPESFGAPRLSRIGERHSLEVPPWDQWRPLGLGKLAGLPPLTELRFLARATYLPFFFSLGSLFARAKLLIVHAIS